MLLNELRGRTIYPKVKLVSETCKQGFFTTGGTLPTLCKDIHPNSVKAVIGLKFAPGERTVGFDINLPRQEFEMGRQGNKLDELLEGWGHRLPLDAICINIPFKLAANEKYAVCTPEMLTHAMSDPDDDKRFYALPICHVEFGNGMSRLAIKGGKMVPTKGTAPTFMTVYKGRNQHFPMPLPRDPSFFEKGYKSYDAGFISMMTSLLDAPIKSDDNTLFPQLLPYNFVATMMALESYWKKCASIKVKASFSVNTKFTGDPMNPEFQDDVLADIWRNVRSFKRTPKVEPAQIRVETTSIKVGFII
jgi:hypothetical protein